MILVILLWWLVIVEHHITWHYALQECKFHENWCPKPQRHLPSNPVSRVYSRLPLVAIKTDKKSNCHLSIRQSEQNEGSKISPSIETFLTVYISGSKLLKQQGFFTTHVTVTQAIASLPIVIVAYCKYTFDPSSTCAILLKDEGLPFYHGLPTENDSWPVKVEM